MPSSLIIVALAAAWLVVLVPMVARSRQEVARPADSALSARVVRSGSARHERREEFAMSENAADGRNLVDDEVHTADDGADSWDEVDTRGEYDYDYEDAGEFEDVAEAGRPEPEYVDTPGAGREGERHARPYRPGRGGFDPEAAEIAARAKYAYRQRVVVGLLSAAVVTAIVAAVLLPVLWWVHAIVDVTLVGYLAYLRRQVRIENEIRERRLARLGRTGEPPARGEGERALGAQELDEDLGEAYEFPEVPEERPRAMSRVQRMPPAEPIRHNGVYVDLDDEDPAFYELDEPGEQPFRKAAGQ